MRHAPRRPLQMKSISGATQECQKRLRFVIISSFVFAVDVLLTHQSKLSIAVTHRTEDSIRGSFLASDLLPTQIALFYLLLIASSPPPLVRHNNHVVMRRAPSLFPGNYWPYSEVINTSDDGYTYTYIYINWVSCGRMAITHQIKKRDWVTDTTSVHRPRIFFRHSPIIL